MKTLLKFFTLFVMLIIASAATFASEKQIIQPPGCTVTMLSTNTITTLSAIPVVDNSLIAHDFLYLDRDYGNHAAYFNEILAVTEKTKRNIIPDPIVQYLNTSKNNTSTHYRNTVRHVSTMVKK